MFIYVHTQAHACTRMHVCDPWYFSDVFFKGSSWHRKGTHDGFYFLPLLVFPRVGFQGVPSIMIFKRKKKEKKTD